MISQLRSIGIAVALLAGAAAAQASLTVYSGVRNSGPIGTVDGTPKTARDNFVAALTSVGSENFDSFANFAPSSSTTLNINFSGSAGGITGSLTGDQMFVVSDTLAQVGGASPTGRFDTTGTGASSDVRKYLEVADSFTLTFSAAVSAFGVYGTDIGDFGGSLDVILTDSSGGQTTRSIQDNNAGGAADGG
ncbi:MAG: hypothetical protein IPL57_21590 [Rubrivivax sp.]|nr:hypothetical protein [Rubrivivax sp.]